MSNERYTYGISAHGYAIYDNEQHAMFSLLKYVESKSAAEAECARLNEAYRKEQA